MSAQQQMKLLEREIHATLVREYAAEVDRDVGALTYEDILELMGRSASKAIGRRIERKPAPKVPWKDTTAVVETFPCTNGDWTLHESLFRVLKSTYPAVNALHAVQEAKLFVMTDRKYTAQGMATFLRNWFKRAQMDAERRAAMYGSKHPAVQPPRPQPQDTRDPALIQEQRAAREANGLAQRAKADSVLDGILRKR